MKPDRGRAVSFGTAASLYEATRPGYPVEASEFVLSLNAAEVAVEVGAGTGKTTEAFARPGLRTTALEPDPDMAALLAAKSLPGVETVVTTFEDWEGPSDPVDLVFAGQVWHWLDRDTACDRARSWLRSGGVLALLWNVPSHRYDRFESVYRQHAPHLLEEGDRRIHFRDSLVWLDDLEAAGFDEPRLTRFAWSADLGSKEVCELYSTYSDHIALPLGTREALLGALGAEVERLGGVVTIEYETRVFTGRRP